MKYLYKFESKGARVVIGKHSWTNLFVSIRSGGKSLSHGLCVRFSMTPHQADAFFAQLATAVGNDAPDLRFRSARGYVGARRRNNRVEIYIRDRRGASGSSCSAALEIPLDHARKLCDEIAPLLGWVLETAA